MVNGLARLEFFFVFFFYLVLTLAFLEWTYTMDISSSGDEELIRASQEAEYQQKAIGSTSEEVDIMRILQGDDDLPTIRRSPVFGPYKDRKLDISGEKKFYMY